MRSSTRGDRGRTTAASSGLERRRLIKHTWVAEATRGIESIVTVTLAPRDRSIEVTLRHTNVPEDEMGRSHKEGWTWYLRVPAERSEKAPED